MPSAAADNVFLSDASVLLWQFLTRVKAVRLPIIEIDPYFEIWI